MIKLIDLLKESLNQQQIVDIAKEFMSSENYNPDHDCKRSTFEFIKWAKKNKGFEPTTLLLAPPKDIKKFPGKSKDGDSHIFSIIDGYGVDFTANQFPGISEPLKITPENQIPSEYKKIGGYYTLFPDWFENGKTSIKTKFNNLPQWFRDSFEKEGFKPKLNEGDPKVGTGKKPKGSSRRLYTDEDPTDTVGVKFKTVQDIKNTLSKSSFKSKSHARQSQIINLIHQRVRAAYSKAKNPEVKARLRKGLTYITARKEASKKKTERLRKLKEIRDLLKEESKKYSTILIFGPQGVGKSTLTKPLGKKLGMKVISSDEFINPGNWKKEKTAKQGWLKRKDNEFNGMVNFLKNHLGQPVILDIGGSHGVWEGNHLSEIKKMLLSYPNTFLMIPSNDMVKSKEYLRKNLLKREMGIEGAIKYWEAILKGDKSFANNFPDEDKEEFMKHLEDVKNGNDKTAKYNIDRMQKRLDIIKSGNVDWKEFDIDDEDSKNVKFAPDEFHDYSNYFITNMKNSGIANHVVYNLGKNTEEVINDIIKVLK